MYIMHVYTWKLLDLHKSKQGNTTNLNISFSKHNGIVNLYNFSQSYTADCVPSFTSQDCILLIFNNNMDGYNYIVILVYNDKNEYDYSM